MSLFQLFQITEVGGFLRGADNDALDVHVLQQLQTVDLVLKTLVRIGDDAHIPILPGFCLYAFHDVGIVVERHVGHHDADSPCRIITKTRCERIRAIPILYRKTLYSLTQFRTDSLLPSQCT